MPDDIQAAYEAANAPYANEPYDPIAAISLYTRTYGDVGWVYDSLRLALNHISEFEAKSGLFAFVRVKDADAAFIQGLKDRVYLMSPDTKIERAPAFQELTMANFIKAPADCVWWGESDAEAQKKDGAAVFVKALDDANKTVEAVAQFADSAERETYIARVGEIRAVVEQAFREVK